MKLRIMISTEKQKVAACFIIIISIMLLFIYPSFSLDFFWDDYVVIRHYSAEELKAAFYSDLGEITDPLIWVSTYRPFTQLMYHVAYEICGFDSQNLHMMSFALHITQTLLAFLFFRMLLRNKNSIALACSLLFSLNPIIYLHFTWPSEMPALSGMIPFLLSLIALLSYMRNPKTLTIVIHCLFAIWAYLTKETYAPLFFITVLTILYYRSHNYRKYLSIISWHGTIFVTYLIVRFSVLKHWGGQGVSPDNYTGIIKYLQNYLEFIKHISLFNHYRSQDTIYFLFYLGLVAVFFAALIIVLISRIKELRNAIQSSSSISLSEKNLQIQHKDPSNTDRKESIMKFFEYSCLFTLIVGIPMFFFPDTRIMNVTALGMGAAFGASFFVVLSVIEEKFSHKFSTGHKYKIKRLLHHTPLYMLILFVLMNGYFFRYQLIDPESFYYRPSGMSFYIKLDHYFKKHNMVEQRKALFDSLVSYGIVDGTTGKLTNKEDAEWAKQFKK